MRSPWTAIAGRIADIALPSRRRSLEGWQRRALNTVVAIVALILLSSVVYHAVMVVFEGRTPSYHNSLRVVVETYTGTGYGGDAPWESAVANLLVATMDLSTFLLLFIVLPYVFAPVLEEALAVRTPTRVNKQDHVVVCGFDEQSQRLVDELDTRGVEYVVVTEREETAVELKEAGLSVIHGDPTSVETLERACVDVARTVVVDTEGDTSASVVLAVREINSEVRTAVVVNHLGHTSQLLHAGADQVLTPRHILGQRIAERVVAELNPRRTDSVVLGEDFAVLELAVSRDQPQYGQTLAEIERDTGVSVVGTWTDGQFVSDPDVRTVAGEGTVLLVAGRESALDALDVDTGGSSGRGLSVVVAGHGVVGSTVRRELDRTLACTVVDIEDGESVDVVGDATDEETLERAGIDDAAALVVTVKDDDQAILSVLGADRLDTDLDIVARVNERAAETKIRRAGADYVLSLPDISGRILAQVVLHEDIVSYNRQLRIVRVEGSRYAGQQLGETAIAESGCIVLAVQRDDQLVTDPSPDLEIAPDDRLVVVGRDEDIDDIAGRVGR